MTETPPPAPPEPPPPHRPELRRLVSYSLASGLAALIPLPIVDDWARDLMRRRLVADLARRHGVALGVPELRALATGYEPATAAGCAQGCLVAAVYRPLRFVVVKVLRKLLRKVLFVLTIKDGVDTFSQTLHEAYLVDHALALGAVPATAPTAAAPEPDPRILSLRWAIEAARDAIDHRPVERLARAAFADSRRLVRVTARRMGQAARRLRRQPGVDEDRVFEQLEREGESRLGGLIDELTTGLLANRQYFERLEKELEKRLA